MSSPYIVVIGAARSGTKILRDTLASAFGIGCVPYDIGYVWRLGNQAHPDDLLTASMLSSQTARYIRHFIDKYRSDASQPVIEKTVGNTLRVPVVDAVLPDARYIHLIRDGADVVESAARQWQAKPSLRYIVRKARHFPVRLAPSYGTRYVRSLAERSKHDDRRVATWGPRYPGIDRDLQNGSLHSVCARQWTWSVSQARADFASLGIQPFELRYERLVREPDRVLDELAASLELELDVRGRDESASRITDTRQGSGREWFDTQTSALLEGEMGELLAALGYEPVSR